MIQLTISPRPLPVDATPTIDTNALKIAETPPSRPAAQPVGRGQRGRPCIPTPRILDGAAPILCHSRVAAVGSFWTAMRSRRHSGRKRPDRDSRFFGVSPENLSPDPAFCLRFSSLAIHRRIRQEILGHAKSARGGSPRVVGVVNCRNTDEALIAEPLCRIVGDQLRPRRGRHAEIFRCSTPWAPLFWDEHCLGLGLLSALRLLQ
jgi:hypothetical protein